MVDPADSINPFPGLATAPPTNVPSMAPSNIGPMVPSLPLLKPAWKRVSTRQWIRDFREFTKHYHMIPYWTVCKMCFITTGYYPDLIDQASLQRYLQKYPASTRKESISSQRYPGHVIYPYPGQSGTDMSSLISTTSMSQSSTVGSKTTTDANANEDRFKFAYDKRTEGIHTRKSLAMMEASRKKSLQKIEADNAKPEEGKRKSMAPPAPEPMPMPMPMPAAVAPAPAEKADKGKKGKKGAEAAAPAAEPAADGAAPAAEKPGKGKKGKKGAEAAAPAEEPAADGAAPAAEKPAKGKKGKKGKEEAAAPAGEEPPSESSAAEEKPAKKKGKKK